MMMTFIAPLIGKSRVLPRKCNSIQRMELTASMLSVKFSRILKRNLKTISSIITSKKYTGQTAVLLGYIRNDIKRFKVIAANK